jgi:hypothetical protein
MTARSSYESCNTLDSGEVPLSHLTETQFGGTRPRDLDCVSIAVPP